MSECWSDERFEAAARTDEAQDGHLQACARCRERLAEARRLVRERHPGEHTKRRTALARLLSPCAVDDLLEGRLDDFETHWKKWTSSLSD